MEQKTLMSKVAAKGMPETQLKWECSWKCMEPTTMKMISNEAKNDTEK